MFDGLVSTTEVPPIQSVSGPLSIVKVASPFSIEGTVNRYICTVESTGTAPSVDCKVCNLAKVAGSQGKPFPYSRFLDLYL